jgi:hypothetical protein
VEVDAMASKLWALAVLVVLVSCSTSDSVDTSLVDAPTSTSMSSATAITSTTTTSMPASTTTPTVAPEPPLLEITDPQPDEVVATAVYTFQGVSDPGYTVNVGGRYFADVDADGNWTIDLLPNPGGNATPFTATDGIGQAIGRLLAGTALTALLVATVVAVRGRLAGAMTGLGCLWLMLGAASLSLLVLGWAVGCGYARVRCRMADWISHPIVAAWLTLAVLVVLVASALIVSGLRRARSDRRGEPEPRP